MSYSLNHLSLMFWPPRAGMPLTTHASPMVSHEKGLPDLKSLFSVTTARSVLYSSKYESRFAASSRASWADLGKMFK